MGLDKRFFQLAQERLAQRRSDNRALEIKRREEIFAKLPQYSRLADELSGTMSEVARILAARDPDAESKVRAQLDKNVNIQRQMNEALTQGGYPLNYLDRIYTCPKCHDKGSVDGEWCGCFRKILTGIAAEDLNARSPLRLSSFESFKIDAYPDEVDEEFGVSKREIMKQNFTDCVKFSEEFNGRGYGLFMIGGTGLGKTHLSLAIANTLIKRGFSVIYGSTPELLRKLQKEQFSRGEKSDDTMMLLTDCDLLILDDLGAESSSEYTASLLYEVINARQSRSIPMIVNTNLDENGLKQRYQDRLWSRLFSMKVLFFRGNDNRLGLAINSTRK